MEYKRLTKRGADYVFDNCCNCEYDNNPMGCTEHCCYEVMKKRLAELEDKIEQGTLVDTETYFIVEENQWSGKNRFLICQNAVQLAVCDFCETREEAEKCLKELQNGR